jgi:hypothetical protein
LQKAAPRDAVRKSCDAFLTADGADGTSLRSSLSNGMLVTGESVTCAGSLLLDVSETLRVVACARRSRHAEFTG